MNLSRFFPFLDWIRSYSKEDLKGDLSAGLTVGMMLIPQGMAYSMLAGLPPIYGLYASIVPLIVYAFFGTSRQLAVGPVAMVSLLVLAAVGTLEPSNPQEFVSYAIVLALIVGAIQFLLGLFRLGFLVNFLSHPVISGFTSAAALIIGLNQLKHLLGISIPKSNFIHTILIDAFNNISETNFFTLAIGLGAILLIIGVRKVNRSIPGPLLAVVGGIAVVWLGSLADVGVKIVGDVPGGLPSFEIPAITVSVIEKLLPMALTISLIAFMESIAVAKAIQRKHKNYKIEANQELIGLGLANILGSFFQSFPTTGGFSRTAVNDQAGARTGMASIISALLVAIALLFLTSLFFFLPKAILASVIMVAVFGLIDFKEAKHLFKTDRNDFFMLIITFIATLALGIEEGILIGIVLSLGVIIYKTTKPHSAELGKIKGMSVYKNIERFEEASTRSDVLVLRFDARLYFANVQHFNDFVESKLLEKGPELKMVILDTESMNDIDSSGAHILSDLIKDLQEKSVSFAIVSAKGPLRDRLKQHGLMNLIGRDNFFLKVQDAVDQFDGKSSNENMAMASEVDV